MIVEIKEILNEITGIPVVEIEEDVDLFALGIDSLMMAEAKQKIEARFGIEIGLEQFFEEAPTVQRVAGMVEELGGNSHAVEPEERIEIPEPLIAEQPVSPEPMMVVDSPSMTFDQSASAPHQGSTLEKMVALQNETMRKQLDFMTMQLEVIKGHSVALPETANHSISFPQPVNQTTAPQPVNKETVSQPASPPTKSGIASSPSSSFDHVQYTGFRSLKFTKDTDLSLEQEQFIADFTASYTKKTPKSKEYATQHRARLSDWINTLGFRLSLKEINYPIVAARSSGTKFWDIDGNEYLDIAMGYGVSYFGHRPPFIMEALESQIKEGYELAPQSDMAGEVAGLIHELTGVERVTFCNTGSEAVMVAIRLARTVTKRKKIALFAGAYHGIYDGVLAVSGEEGTLPIAAGILPEMVENVVVLSYNTPKALNEIRKHGEELAAILVEPVQSRQPHIQPKEFLQQLRQLSSEIGAALIFDEMITGFRCHPGGVQGYFGVKADIVTYGKTVGGGMPIGIVAGTARFMDAVDGGAWRYGDDSCPDKEGTFFGGTFCKHPLTLASARAALLYMKEQGPGLQERVNRLTDNFAKKINAFFEEEAVPLQVTYFASQFRFEGSGKYNFLFKPLEVDLFFYLLMGKGIYTWEKRICFFSTQHTEEEAEFVIQAIKDTIREMREVGFFSLSDKSASEASQNDLPLKKKTKSRDGLSFSHPMSSGQKRLFIISQHARGAENYNLCGACWLSGKLDVKRLEHAFQVLIERHESLRSSFLVENEEWLCRVHPEVPFELMVQEGGEASVEELVSGFIQPFDLSKPPLLRAGVCRFSEDRYLLIIDAHHIILDGLSMSVFIQELMNPYQGLSLPPLQAQFKDYVSWQNRFFQSPAFIKQETYWLEHLSEEFPVLDLPMDTPRGTESHFRRADFFIQHPSAELSALAKSQGTSLYMVLVAAYYVWLFRLTGQENIVIGTVSSHRPFVEFNQIIGMITNTLAMRAYPAGSKDFATFLKEVKTVCLESYANPDYPFERLVEKLELTQPPNRHPVFETMFSYEKASERMLRLKDIEVTLCFEKHRFMFDLAVDVIEKTGVLHFNFEYDSSLFRAETMRRFAGYLVRILEELPKHPEQKLSEIEILPTTEKQQLLVEFNQTQMEYPQDKNWVNLFEEQVEKNPEAIALVCGSGARGERLTYQQLNERANQVAHQLKERFQIGKDDRVAILMERTEWMMIALLGILKAGGAYVPIDPNFPTQRIEYILQDSQTKVVLTEDEVRGKVSLPSFVEVVEIFWITTGEKSNLDVTIQPSDLAYLIYTSGSTGNPKGVMIEHRNVISFAANLPDTFDISPTDIIYGLTTLTFDISVLELLCSLIHGIRIVLASNKERNDPKAIGQVLQQKEITVLQVTPSRLKWLLESQHVDVLQSLNVLLVGGEALPKSLAEQLQVLRNTKVFNVYGPTETTIWSTANLLKDGEVTIGTPLLNEEVYVLSEHGQLQPLGVIGELCIGGAGVGRGYANRPELTAEKFVKNPFRKGENLYRTGDLARWMPDGNLEFLGRGDDQVKIRGHRVELGEIEHYLQNHPAIEEAVVVAREVEDGEKELAAYLKGDEGLEIAKLRQFLSESLPENLIPSYFTWLDQFPLNPSGKINRGALPEPEGKALHSAYAAPRNEIEAKLVELWEEILGQSPIGIHDNFFDRGGHSLKTVQLFSRIQKHLEVELSLKDIFSFSTVAKLATVITGQEVKEFAPIEPVEEAADYALSHAQQRLWVLHQLEESSVVYNVTGALLLEGNLNQEALIQSLQALVARHESLRTSFVSVAGEPRQKIEETAELQLEEVDLRQQEDPVSVAQDMVQAEGNHSFDLEKGPLFRVKLLKLSLTSHVLVVNLHHVICDGWSLGVLSRELGVLYHAVHQGESNPLPPLAIQYKDYSAWQTNWLAGEEARQSREYWHEQLSGELPILELPTDRPRPLVQTFAGSTFEKQFSPQWTQRANELMRQEDSTLFMGLVALVKILLYRYSGQEEILVGSSIAGRRHVDLENQIGCYINMLPLRDTIEGSQSFASLLAQVKQTTLAAYEYQDYPFDQLVDELKLERDLSRSPLFDVIVSLQNEEQSPPQLEELQIEDFSFSQDVSRLDLTFNFMEQGDGLICEIEYNTNLFNEGRIERMGNHLEILLDSILNSPAQPIDELNLLKEREREQLLVEFNATASEYPKDKSVVELFEEQVSQTPNATALVFEEISLSYKQLNAQANQVATHLREKFEVQPEDVVAIITEHSERMVIAVLGILKAGAAYLPIDPLYPNERIEHVLQEAEPKMLFVDAAAANRVSETTIPQCSLDWNADMQNVATDNLSVVTTPSSLAYIMYTSGTTGIPKGSLIEHRSIVRLVKNTNYMEIEPTDRILQTGSLAFDASTLEIWGALLNGAQLHLARENKLLNAIEFRDLLAQRKITIIYLASGLLNQFIDIDSGMFTGLKYLLTGGERLSLPHINKTRSNHPDLEIINGCGPTENTTFSACYRINHEFDQDIPIGKLVANTRGYILNNQDQLQPIGVPGEWCLSGDGLARKYLKNDPLTAEKFVSNPFEPGERMYRSGDICRWTEDGNIEHLGRKDDQVKIRGYRVEPAEIQHCLQEYPSIREAVVVTREVEGGRELVAYLVSDQQLETPPLWQYLFGKLPKYMIPSYFIQLKQLPLNRNGKVDKKALPDPEGGALTSSPYQAPRNSLEVQLVSLWEEILGQNPIGIYDNFFERGGHSLKAVQLVSRIHQQLELEASLRDVFAFSTIAQLAEVMQNRDTQAFQTIQPVAPAEDYHLSHAQRRLWLSHQFEENPVAYNIAEALRLEGNLDKDALFEALKALSVRHEALRTTFLNVGGEPKQKIHPVFDFQLEEIDLSQKKNPDQHAQTLVQQEVHQPFDLEKGPLVRVKLIKLCSTAHVLFINLHHIICDGWSVEVMVQELGTLYRAFHRGETNPLLPLSIQYKDYAAWQQKWLEGQQAQEDRAYWHQKLSGNLPILELPTDRPRPAIQTFPGNSFWIEMEEELTQEIQKLMQAQKVTLFMGLIALVKILLYRYSGQEDIIVGTPVAGRRHADLEDQIGCYLNTLALRNSLGGSQSFETFLVQVKQTTLEAYEHQEYPFDRLLDELNLERNLAHSPLFDIMVVLQNQEQSPLILEELSVQEFPCALEVSKFDIAFNFMERSQRLLCEMIYNTDLFDQESISQMGEHFQMLVQSVIDDPNQALHSLSLSKENEQQPLPETSEVSTQFHF